MGAQRGLGRPRLRQGRGRRAPWSRSCPRWRMRGRGGGRGRGASRSSASCYRLLDEVLDPRLPARHDHVVAVGGGARRGAAAGPTASAPSTCSTRWSGWSWSSSRFRTRPPRTLAQPERPLRRGSARRPWRCRTPPASSSTGCSSPTSSTRCGCSSATASTPEAIDTCMKLGAGHPMGPLALLDFVGLDVAAAIGESIGAEVPESPARADRGRASSAARPARASTYADALHARGAGPGPRPRPPRRCLGAWPAPIRGPRAASASGRSSQRASSSASSARREHAPLLALLLIRARRASRCESLSFTDHIGQDLLPGQARLQPNLVPAHGRNR